MNIDIRTRYDVDHHHQDGTRGRMTAEADDVNDRMSAEMTTSRNELQCECGATVSVLSTTTTDVADIEPPALYVELGAAAVAGHMPSGHEWSYGTWPSCHLCGVLDRIMDAAPDPESI